MMKQQLKYFCAFFIGFAALFPAHGAAVNSPEDFAEGRKMLDEMKNITYQPVLSRPKLFIRSQTKYSGRLHDFRYQFDDRPLFLDRALRGTGKSDHTVESYKKTLELYQLAGLDGFATFAWPAPYEYERSIKPIFDSAAQLELDPAKFNLLLEIAPNNYIDINENILKLIESDPRYLEIDGKKVISSYVLDTHSATDLKTRLDQLRSRTKTPLLLLPQIHFLTLKDANGRPLNSHDLYYMYRKEKSIPASAIRAMQQYLRDYLESCDGLYIGPVQSRPDLTLDEEFEEDVLIPVFKSVLNEAPYKGKKMLALQGKTAYTAFYGAQTLSRDGTKTLRKSLDSMLKHRPDLYIGTEWDELNEDTGFEPLVSKPMANQRILRYYGAKLRNEFPTPNPGDDLSIPNLIVSQRRQIAPGTLFELELLQVPDGSKEQEYTVQVDITDENDKVLYQSKPLSFNTAKLTDRTLALPSENFAPAETLRTRLTVDYNGVKQVFYVGLPFTIVRSHSWDQQYFCTPLRNVLTPLHADVRFSGKQLQADFSSKTLLAFVEAVENGLEVMALDPDDEFLRNDPERTFFRLKTDYAPNGYTRITAKLTGKVEHAPSLKLLNGTTFDRTIALDWYDKSVFFSVKTDELDQAVLQISGERLDGSRKNESFSWSVPLAQFKKHPVISKVFDDGVSLTLEADGRPATLPKHLNVEKISFTRTLPMQNPDAVLALRVISKDGKVFWSAPYVVDGLIQSPEITGRFYSDAKGKAVDVKLPAKQLPVIRYRFEPALGNILATDAGREYYGILGSYMSLANDFQGVESNYLVFSQNKGIFPEANKFPPEWSKDENGRDVLYFDGENGNFLGFPNLLMPQRSAFTIRFEIKPEKLKPYFVLFSNEAIIAGGLTIAVRDGKLELTFMHRNPHDANLPWYSASVFKTAIPVIAGQWQEITVSYDGDYITASGNGKSESFRLRGITLYNQLSHFGGRGARQKDGSVPFYQGWLRSFEVKHFAE